jgi:hypothetical protein
MKYLKIISKSFVLLLVLLQTNVTNAKELDNSIIVENDLATQIALSNEGKEYFVNNMIYSYIVTSQNLYLTDNELLIRKEKLEKFKTITFKNLSLESKTEFAKLAGFESFEAFEKITNERSESYRKLINTFPIIATLNQSEKTLLLEESMSKMDLDELSKNSFKASCLNTALNNLAKCVGLGQIQKVIFEACMALAITGEEDITDGAATAAAEALIIADTFICKRVAGVVKGGGDVKKCSVKFLIAVVKCFK